MSELEYPEDLRYSTDHEWVRVLEGTEEAGPGVVRVGITAYAQDALGDIVYVTLPEVDTTVSEGQACGEVESTKSVSDVFCPLSGTVVAVNEELDSTPELVNTDPYGEGWMFDLRIDDLGELDGLLDSRAYQAELD